jgi:general secretion pathway protein L
MAATGGILKREITLGSLKNAFLRFWAWESAECRAILPILPRAAVVWLMGRGAREAIVRSGASELIVAAESGGQEIRISGAEIAATSLDAAFARRGLSRKSIAIVLEMPSSAFLTRQFDAPAAALNHLPQILDAEIGRKTPFRRDEVLLGHHVAPHGAKGKATILMALVRRDLVAPALEPCGLALNNLAAIRAVSASASGGSLEQLAIRMDHGGGSDRRYHRAALAMILIAALLTGAGLAATFWRQSQEADELDARIAEMSARASRVRQIADRASKESRLLAILHETRRRNALITELWEEVSRLMPDSAFLTNFRVVESKAGERSVELIGFAQSAVGLPLLFDQSKYFSEATLTAPITYDPKDKRESFSLRLRARAPVPVAAAVDSVSGNDKPAIAEPPR